MIWNFIIKSLLGEMLSSTIKKRTIGKCERRYQPAYTKNVYEYVNVHIDVKAVSQAVLDYVNPRKNDCLK